MNAPFELERFEYVLGGGELVLLRVRGQWTGGNPQGVELLIEEDAEFTRVPALPDMAVVGRGNGVWRAAFRVHLDLLDHPDATYWLAAEHIEPIELPSPVQHAVAQAASRARRDRATERRPVEDTHELAGGKVKFRARRRIQALETELAGLRSELKAEKEAGARERDDLQRERADLAELREVLEATASRREDAVVETERLARQTLDREREGFDATRARLERTIASLEQKIQTLESAAGRRDALDDLADRTLAHAEAADSGPASLEELRAEAVAGMQAAEEIEHLLLAG